MREVSSLVKALNWPARALARETKGSRDGGDAKKRPLKPAGPNFVIATCDRLAMKKIKVHSLTGRITSRLMRQAFQAVEPQFHEHSYGFIPGRNCHQAIERVLELHRQGRGVVLDADIQGFFDNLSHRVIMGAVAAEVADGNILRLVERFLTAGVMEDKVFKPTTIGTPQGAVHSSNDIANKVGFLDRLIARSSLRPGYGQGWKGP